MGGMGMGAGPGGDAFNPFAAMGGMGGMPDVNRMQQQLFSEAQGRVVATIAPASAKAVIAEAVACNVPVRVIGKVVPQGAAIAVDGHDTLRFSTAELSRAYYDALENELHLNELL